MTDTLETQPPSDQTRSLRRLAWLMFTPIVLLAGIGVYHLIADRALARAKAERDAEKFLNTLVKKLDLAKFLEPELRFADGRLTGLPDGMEPEAVIVRSGSDHKDLYPRPLPEELPATPEDLPHDLKAAWTKAEQAEFSADHEAAMEAYQELSISEHEYVSSNARYRLGVIMLRSGLAEQSDEILQDLTTTLPVSDPLCRRAHWHLVNGFMTKRRTLYHPMTNVVEKACHAWSSHPDSESRDFLKRLVAKAEEMRHNIVAPIVSAAINRVERDDRARELSPEIHSPKWPGSSYALNEDTPRYVMVRDIENDDGRPPDELLVIWRGHQIYNPLWDHIFRMDSAAVDLPDNIAELAIGHSRGTFSSMVLWTPAGKRSKANKKTSAKAGSFEINIRKKTERIASVRVGGFDFSARTLAGAALSESNRRIQWFALLILSAGAISGMAWWHTRSSVLMLAALNEQKSNFVSSVSHELRAPVASMQLMTESLSSGKVTTAEKRNEYYDLILQECRRLGGLVHNVLDYSRIEQKRKNYEFEACDVSRLVENSVKLMEPAAAEHRINLKCEAVAVEAEVDGEALQQALINLIDNGIKFAPQDSTVWVRLAEGVNGECELRVTDSGPGIPEEEREKIFERFYRQENELRRETTGVGIGLSIVKHIIDAHGGAIFVEAAEPSGSIFTIRIPKQQEGKET